MNFSSSSRRPRSGTHSSSPSPPVSSSQPRRPHHGLGSTVLPHPLDSFPSTSAAAMSSSSSSSQTQYRLSRSPSPLIPTRRAYRAPGTERSEGRGQTRRRSSSSHATVGSSSRGGHGHGSNFIPLSQLFPYASTSNSPVFSRDSSAGGVRLPGLSSSSSPTLGSSPSSLLLPNSMPNRSSTLPRGQIRAQQQKQAYERRRGQHRIETNIRLQERLQDDRSIRLGVPQPNSGSFDARIGDRLSRPTSASQRHMLHPYYPFPALDRRQPSRSLSPIRTLLRSVPQSPANRSPVEECFTPLDDTSCLALRPNLYGKSSTLLIQFDCNQSSATQSSTSDGYTTGLPTVVAPLLSSTTSSFSSFFATSFDSNQPPLLSTEEISNFDRGTGSTINDHGVASHSIFSNFTFSSIEKRERELDALLRERRLSHSEEEAVKRELRHLESTLLLDADRRLAVRDFESLAVLGRGAYGEVHLVRKIDSRKIFALKRQSKAEMIRRNKVRQVINERNALIGLDNPWTITLHYTFQDEEYLYMVMDFCPGGDFMNWLIARDILTEDEARFYIAEIVLAIDSIHQRGYVHRDIKPDNILVDADGHIKLTDMGLSRSYTPYPDPEEWMEDSKDARFLLRTTSGEIRGRNMQELRKANRQMLYSTVGTPGYVSKEVLTKSGYGQEAEWWSVGVILFECLCGYAPFYSADPKDCCRRIVHYKETLKFPPNRVVSPEAKDLICSLITEPEIRLGTRGGAQEILNHPFFSSVDIDDIRSQTAPFRVVLKSETDTSYFDSFPSIPLYPSLSKETHVSEAMESSTRLVSESVQQQLNEWISQSPENPFQGFTYKRNQMTKTTSLSELFTSPSSSAPDVSKIAPRLQKLFLEQMPQD